MVIYYCNIFNIDSSYVIKNLTRLDKFNKYKNKNDKLLSMASEYLLNYVYTCNFSDDLLYEYDSKGKIILLNHKDYHVSISHKNEYVVLAIEKDKVGIDIEFIKNINYIELINHYNMNISSCSLIDFYKHYTILEAYGKYLGSGINKDILKININNILQDYKSIKFKNDYVISVVSDKINTLELKEIYGKITKDNR